MLDYIIKILIFQTFFLAIYDLLLKRETFFHWNRTYLILTSLIAYIIPLVKFKKAQEIIPQKYIVRLPEVILSPTTTIERTFDWSSLLFTVFQNIFYIGILIATSLFIIKLYKILQLVFTNEKENKGNYTLVFLENNTAFSFFKYIFLRKSITQQNKNQIIEHEFVHVQQKHTIDLLFFELQRIVFWFNPFSYIYQHRISELHEFIADAKAIKKTDKISYFKNLLAETFVVQHISFINPFFKHSLIKKRIIMIHKNHSRSLFKLKYLLLFPLLASMLIYSSCENGTLEYNKFTKQELAKLSLEVNTSEEIPNFRRSDKYKSFRTFLEENPNYLVWMSINSKGNFLLEIHHEDEKPPEQFVNLGSPFNVKNRSNINMYVDLTNMKKLKKNTKDHSDTDLVAFAGIDKAPIFPGCQDAQDHKQCFIDKVKEHVALNFDTTMTQNLGLKTGRKKVYVQFKIDKSGNIVDVKARGPHKILEDEALRVIHSLPQMKPGEQNGHKVPVKYTLPISFQVD